MTREYWMAIACVGIMAMFGWKLGAIFVGIAMALAGGTVLKVV